MGELLYDDRVFIIFYSYDVTLSKIYKYFFLAVFLEFIGDEY